MKKIFLIEDDINLVRVMGDCLKSNNYTFNYANDGYNGLNKLLEIDCDLLLIDLMLPDSNGLDIIRELRSKGRTFPIVIVSAKFQLSDKINGLKTGADDYLVKPFDYDELLARVEAHLRREEFSSLTEKENKIITFGDLSINLLTREVMKNKKSVALTKIEFMLLAYLVRNSNRVVTIDELLENVWGYQEDFSLRTIYVHIAWLRKKIEDKKSKYIKTIRGVGYQFKI